MNAQTPYPRGLAASDPTSAPADMPPAEDTSGIQTSDVFRRIQSRGMRRSRGSRTAMVAVPVLMIAVAAAALIYFDMRPQSFIHNGPALGPAPMPPAPAPMATQAAPPPAAPSIETASKQDQAALQHEATDRQHERAADRHRETTGMREAQAQSAGRSSADASATMPTPPTSELAPPASAASPTPPAPQIPAVVAPTTPPEQMGAPAAVPAPTTSGQPVNPPMPQQAQPQPQAQTAPTP